MLFYPNAKINIGLYVTDKRTDGYHNIETLFFPIPLHDVLEIIPKSLYGLSRSEGAGGEDGCRLTLSGIPVEGDIRTNLCMKAYQLLRWEFDLPDIEVYLHKCIPTGAGLGGGSSDGAFMLMALNKVFKLHLSQLQLQNYAARLGSDCAFFILNRPALGTERGNCLTPITFDLRDHYLVVVVPDMAVSTSEAYRLVVPHKPNVSLVQKVQYPMHLWKDAVRNDFEPSVFERFPLIGEIKERLYREGAVYASMSGSGSSVFGIFKTVVDANAWFSNITLKWCGGWEMGALLQDVEI